MYKKRGRLLSFLFIILILSTVYAFADIGESIRIAKLDENLTNLLENGNLEEEIVIHIEIKIDSNEYAEEIRRETKVIAEQITNKSNEIKQIYREIDDEIGYDSNVIAENFRENNETFIQQYQAKYQEIISRNNYDEIIKETLVDIEALRDIKREKTTNILKDAFYPSQEKVLEEISKIEDTELIARHIAMNAITLRTKAKHILDIANINEISKLYRSETGSLELDISRSAMGANQWHNQGYEGGLYDVLIIDTGIDMSHPALTNVERKQKTLGYPNQYCSSQTDYDDSNGHGTHVAGIVKAQQGFTSYKGIAPNPNGDIFNGKLCRGAGVNYEDVQEGVDWGVITGVGNEFADVISLSSGWGSEQGGDHFQSKYADAVVYNYDTNWVKSAGNAGPTANSITRPGDAYNIVAVGNINDNNTLTRTDDTLDSSSSRGPVGGSRIKPDIVAPGMYIISTNNDWESQSEYVSKSGTSMAAPHISGAILLLYNYGIVNSLEQRALLLNSATDCELNDPQGGDCPGDDGPDNNYGFGYIDMVETWTHKDDVASAFISPGGDEMYKLTSQDGGDTVTLVWNRFVNNVNATSVDILNLKFYGYDEYDGSLIDSDTTGTDVRRQLQMPGGGVSTLIVRLTADSGYSGPSSEEYAIAHQGSGTITQIAEPTISSSFTTTTSFDCQNQFTVKSRATNNGPIKIHNVEALLNVPPGLTLISGNNPQVLGTINAPPSTNYAEATWILQASSPDEKTLYANITSTSYSLVLESLATQIINITGTCGNIPPVVQFVQVTPAQPLSTDTLDCAFNVSDDANFTSYSYNLSWYKNEVRQTENNEIGSFTPGIVVNSNDIGDVESGYTSAGEEWICSVEVGDGFGVTEKNATTVLIQGGPPSTPTMLLCDDINCTENRTFNAAIIINASGSVDQEGNAITYSIEAFYNHTGDIEGRMTTFNNSLSEENMSFSKNKDIVRYLEIQQNVTISGATLKLKGFESGIVEDTGLSCNYTTQNHPMEALSYNQPEETLFISRDFAGSGSLIFEIMGDNCAFDDTNISVNNADQHQIKGIWFDNTQSRIWACDYASEKCCWYSETGSGPNSCFETKLVDPPGSCPIADQPLSIVELNGFFYIYDGGVAGPAKPCVHKFSAACNSGGSCIHNETAFDLSADFGNNQDADIETDGSFFYIKSGTITRIYDLSFNKLKEIDSGVGAHAITRNSTNFFTGKDCSGGNCPTGVLNVLIGQNSFPDDVLLDVGNDGDSEFSHAGELNTEIITNDLSTEINSHLTSCTPIEGNCTIPFNFSTSTFGTVNYNTIQINFLENLSDYFFDVIGNQSENETFLWNLSNISEQSDVMIRTRATDENGSKLYSDYFSPNMNITISTNNPPQIEFVMINPTFPSTLDTLDCGFAITDLDVNDILTANVTWSRDNLPYDADNETLTVINGSLANTTVIGDIEPEDTTTDEEWVCIVTADDGEMTTMKLSNTTTIIRQMVANLSLLNTNGLTAIYEFAVINPYPATSEFPWILDLGDSNQVSNATNISLVQNEDVFVYVEYTYGATGQYNVTARVTNFDIVDEETFEVTI